MTFRSLLCGLPQAKRKGRPFMLLRAYFDDSGSDGRSPYYVLAGYLSVVERWEAFADRWAATLSEEPAIKYFKTREAYRLRDQFNGWSAEDRDEKVKALRQIIAENAMTG